MADNIQYKPITEEYVKPCAETYIPRRGDLIRFVDFNDAVGMIVESSSFLGWENQRMIKYKFVFPDTKPFQFAREVGGAREVFLSNHLMSIYNKPLAKYIDIVVKLIELKEILDRKKWKVQPRKQ